MNQVHTPFKNSVREFRLDHDNQALPFGIGCAWLGRGDMDEQTVQREVAVLEAAYEMGFRYFDTSAAYGNSEQIVGGFVKQIPRDQIFLATKSRIPETATIQQAREYMRSALEQSLERLETDHLDLYQIHDVDHLAQVLPVDGVLDWLLEAKSKGLFRYVGLATRNHELLHTAVQHGGFDTILTYSDYTPLEQSARSLIEAANGRGIGVINASPLLFGLLNGQDPSVVNNGQDPQSVKRKQLAMQLFTLCRENNISLLRLALQFPSRNSDIDITLTGPSTVEELQSTLHALTSPLTPEEWGQWETWYQHVAIHI